MSIDVKDLPPAYQAQAMRKWVEQEREKGRGPFPSPAAVPSKGRKYHNKPTERVTPAGEVLRFDSKKEACRYDELLVMLQAGKIRDLKLQPQFTIEEAYTTIKGVRVRAIRYHADFSYIRPAENQTEHVYWADNEGIPWRLVVEDVKSRATKTRVYAMKKKLMQEKFGIEIKEI